MPDTEAVTITRTVPGNATGADVTEAIAEMQAELGEAGGDVATSWSSLAGQDDGTSLLTVTDGPNPWL